jgi:putative membrane protein
MNKMLFMSKIRKIFKRSLYMKKKSEVFPINQLKYAQQHLANERTYLAWIRTAISIVGVGFLATSLHFTLGNIRNPAIDILSIVLGIFACFFGIIVIFITTSNYKKKQDQITQETFIPSQTNISLISGMLIILILLIITYFFLIL